MRRTLAGMVLALAAWAAIMLLMPFVGPSGRQVAVVGDSGTAIRAIAAAGGRIVEVRRKAVIAISEDAGFPKRLYQNGAPLVIEGRIGAACFGALPS
jgi:hypothetical protein